MKLMNTHHVEVAAESLAASLMSQLGWDVLVRYGANLPEYDILATKEGRIVKVSSKGSQDGGWGLTQGYKKGKSYKDAAQHWVNKHSPDTLVFLVQFQDIEAGKMPLVYVARPQEIGDYLANARDGHGETTILVSKNYKKGIAAGTKDRMPDAWIFSEKRLNQLLSTRSKVAKK